MSSPQAPPKRITRDAQGRIPSLDGLRALSIAGVLYGHLTGTAGFPGKSLGRTLDLGNLGVRVFFVISGFLITTLLLEEHDKHGRISLRGFYIRRTFRIFPAFYVFLGVIFALRGFGIVDLLPNDAVAALTYTMNFHRPRAWELGHLWSLCVEEQFYLVWPAIMLVFGARRATIVAFIAAVSAPCIRLTVARIAPSHMAGIGETFPTVMDTIATGCVLAGIRPWLSANAGYMRFLRGPQFWVAMAIAFASLWIPSTRLNWLVGESLRNVAMALLIDRVVRFPETWFGKVCNWRPLVGVGVLSYSLYLWQQPLLNRHADRLVNCFPLNIILAFAAATLSYKLVEKPILDLRTRLKLG